MKKIFLIIGVLSILSVSSHAAGWTANEEILFYNFYVDKAFLGESF
tara:strand:+ start:261 stop:398 length:138 start_codon:yes stop_codon:yes gene_type:complete